MTYSVPTRYEEMVIKVTVATIKPQKIRLIVRDSQMRNTSFTNRWKTVNGQVDFFVRMPVSGSVSLVDVYNEKNGNLPKSEDDTFEVVSIDRLPLEKKIDVSDFSNPMVRSFIKFNTKFCFNAGVIPSGTYRSGDGRFTFEYLPTIVGDNGKPLNTPARISQNTGVIQISQAKYIEMTVPMRFAINCHEFAHYYLNDNMHDETEADLNGLMIYLGLGYPRIEAHEAFLSTFVNVPSDQNGRRYQMIKKFIDDFENNKIILYE